MLIVRRAYLEVLKINSSKEKLCFPKQNIIRIILKFSHTQYVTVARRQPDLVETIPNIVNILTL